MVNFLAEITARFETVINPTPYNKIAKQYNIYYINIKPYPFNSYWLNWGGFYDNFTGSQIELYYGQFLTKVNTIDELLNNQMSLLLTENLSVLINIPIHPWLYPLYISEGSHVLPFLSSALNPNNPSDNAVRGVNAPVKLLKPNFSIKLSDNMSGIILNQGFSIELINNDSQFDDDELWNLFNTPIYLKKSYIHNPEYKDFKTIRYGMAENIKTDFNTFKVYVADRLRSMDEPVCNLILQDNFPNIIIFDTALNKNIPIVYGTKKINLQRLNNNTYLAAEYVSSIEGIFDIDGTSLAYNFNNTNGLITLINPNLEASYCIMTGYEDNKIGNIIAGISERKALIQVSDSNWNIEELNKYIDISPKINIVIDQGDIKSAIQNILKNDMAFFIQQTDGRFTVRKYGETYTVHEIESWAISNKPNKDWKGAQENYFSSCIINYDFKDSNTYKSLFYTEREKEAEVIYRRRVIKVFDTDLVDESEALNIAKLLADRFLILRQTLTLPIDADTSYFELLDTIKINVNINDRVFSKANTFFIKEINPTNDILTLEELPI